MLTLEIKLWTQQLNNPPTQHDLRIEAVYEDSCAVQTRVDVIGTNPRKHPIKKNFLLFLLKICYKL